MRSHCLIVDRLACWYYMKACFSFGMLKTWKLWFICHWQEIGVIVCLFVCLLACNAQPLEASIHNGFLFVSSTCVCFFLSSCYGCIFYFNYEVWYLAVLDWIIPMYKVIFLFYVTFLIPWLCIPKYILRYKSHIFHQISCTKMGMLHKYLQWIYIMMNWSKYH